MVFADRAEAGRRLAAALRPSAALRPVVLALPRGGVPVALAVAEALDAPLGLVVVRKIGAPGESELALGAIADSGTPITVRNEALIRATGTSEAAFERVAAAEGIELARRRRRYLEGRPAVDLADREVIVVDDGIATGATMTAALRAARRLAPRRLVLAVPVAAPEALAALAQEADEILCLETPADFGSVGRWYRSFPQVSDAEVIAALARRPPFAAA